MDGWLVGWWTVWWVDCWLNEAKTLDGLLSECSTLDLTGHHLSSIDTHGVLSHINAPKALYHQKLTAELPHDRIHHESEATSN
jgi:hypothetical protein